MVGPHISVGSTCTAAEELQVDLSAEPGETFHYRGTHFYVATELRTVVELSEPAFLAVSGLLRGDTCADIQQRLAQGGYDLDAEGIRKLLSSHRDLGLFRTAEAAKLAESTEEHVHHLLKHQPMKLMLLVAQTCNLRCDYCYGIDRNYSDSGHRMTCQTAVQAVEHLFRCGRRRGHFYVYFFGGEPLLNLPAVRAAVERARQLAAEHGKTVEFGITTNGTLIDDATADFLISEDFQICLSLDGSPVAHDMHRKTRGGGGTHARALAGLGRLRSRSKRPGQIKIRATMTTDNHDPEAIASYFHGIGLRNFGIGSAMERTGCSGKYDITEADLEEMDTIFERMLDAILDRMRERQPLPVYNPFFRSIRALTTGRSCPSLGCGACRNDQGVDVDGQLYPCHRYVGMTDYSIGDIHAGFDLAKVRDYYEDYFGGWLRHCSRCWARYICNGACPWQYSTDEARLARPLPYQCRSIKRSIRRSAWLSLHLAKNFPETLQAISRLPVGGGCCGVHAEPVVAERQDV